MHTSGGACCEFTIHCMHTHARVYVPDLMSLCIFMICVGVIRMVVLILY